MITDIGVIGFPSYLGGADTELYDQIKLWSSMGITTHICNTTIMSPNYKKLQLEEKYNCVITKPRDWKALAGLHCISYCNGYFLKELHVIKQYVKSTTFVNCMSFNFKDEIKCQFDDLIDFHLYQSKFSFNKIYPSLHKLGKSYRPLFYVPYFDVSNFPYQCNRPNDKFRFGRISRIDLKKFNVDQFKLYDDINVDNKSGLVLGWHNQIQAHLEISKNCLNKECNKYKSYIQLFACGEVTQQDFYKFCDVLILMSDTQENYPRIHGECCASGTIMIVDNRGGWKDLINHGVDGFLCDSYNDFLNYSQLMNNDIKLKEQIRSSAFDKISNQDDAQSHWKKIFKEWENFGI